MHSEQLKGHDWGELASVLALGIEPGATETTKADAIREALRDLSAKVADASSWDEVADQVEEEELVQLQQVQEFLYLLAAEEMRYSCIWWALWAQCAREFWESPSEALQALAHCLEYAWS